MPDTTAPTDTKGRRAQLAFAAEAAVRELEEAQRQDADPTHEDWYVIAGALDEITHRLSGLTRGMAIQVQRYGDRRVRRDDEGVDPAARADEAYNKLIRSAIRLLQANEAVRAAHSELSHIAVAVDADEVRAR